MATRTEPPTSFSRYLGLDSVGQEGLTQLAQAIQALALSLTGQNFPSISHAVRHLVGMTFVRLAQPPAVEQQRWTRALRVIGQLYLCPDLEARKIPDQIDLEPLTTFLDDLIESRVAGIDFEPEQKGHLELMLKYLRSCEKGDEGFELIGAKEQLPEALRVGERALGQLHAKYISLQGLFQRAVRQADPASMQSLLHLRF